MSQAYFVTGTDTAVGKTLISCALLNCARDAGLQALGLKPVAAGCELHEGVWANEDAWLLMQSSSGKRDYADINPVALREAMAPHIAAACEGFDIDLDKLLRHCRAMTDTAEFTVIEGAGGWDVPLNDHSSMADLAGELGYPVIMVVGVRLGCLNHALLTAAAIRAQGLILAGWVANRIDPNMAVAIENIATLTARLAAPLLGTVSWQADPDPAIAATELDFGRLNTGAP